MRSAKLKHWRDFPAENGWGGRSNGDLQGGMPGVADTIPVSVDGHAVCRSYGILRIQDCQK